MFEKSLTELVKGIRNAKDNEAAYISKSLAEIKAELRQPDAYLKAQAVQKLIYLQMLGYEMPEAAFHVVEVMSQPWFGHKRIGYLAACQLFTPKTDVILLTTHLFRKAFSQSVSNSSEATEGLQYEVGSAINCLANICTPELAMDILSDIYGMMNSSRPYVRKKAVLVLLKIFMAWPKALRLSFDRLKEKLQDEDPNVVSAAVYVLCELARRNPKNYVALAPLFFKILTTFTNNWLLIKVVKLLGFLVPLEPRLAKKLANPLSDIIESTPAKSLMYECINTLLSGELTSKNVVRLCLTKLGGFIGDRDQNLKYLGLLGLHKLMKQHPRAVEEHRDVIIDCLKDEDVTIRTRALDLVCAMVSQRTLKAIVAKLFENMELAEGNYRELLMERIISLCAQDSYAFVGDFEWYVTTLVTLSHVSGASKENAARVAEQLVDVTVRVEEVQAFAVRKMAELIVEQWLQNSHNNMSDVLASAGWIVGEYAELLDNQLEVLSAMLSPAVMTLSPAVQNVFLQNFLKVFAAGLNRPHAAPASAGKGGELDLSGAKQINGKAGTSASAMAFDEWQNYVRLMSETIAQRLPLFCTSNNVEVQERAVAYNYFCSWISTQVLSTADTAALVSYFASMSAEKLEPVHPQAQKKVPVPKGLNLDKWINEPQPDSDDEAQEDDGYSLEQTDGFGGGSGGTSGASARSKQPPTAAELEEQRKRRQRERERRANDPYYISDKSSARARADADTDVNVDDIPIKPVQFDLPELQVEQTKRSSSRSASMRDIFDVKDSAPSKTYTVKKESAAPTGFKADADRARADKAKGDNLDEVDLSRPLDASEIIPRVRSYKEQASEKQQKESEKDEKRKHKKEKKERKDKKEKKKDEAEESKEADKPTKSKTKDAQPKTANVLDIFDPLAPAPSAAVPVATAATDDNKEGKEKKQKKHHKKEKQDSEKPSDTSATSGEKHKHKHKEHHHHHHHEESSALSEPPHPLREQTILKDDNISLKWTVVTERSQAFSATGVVFVAVTKDVEDVQVSVGDNNQVRAKGSRVVSFPKLSANSAATGSITLQLAKVSAAQRLDVQVSYKVAGGAATKRTAAVDVPCSALVHPVKLSMEELREILVRTDDRKGDTSDQYSCTALASNPRITLQSYTIAEALKLIVKILNVRLIEAVSFTATYYGKSIQGHHVAVLVKASKQEVQQERPTIAVDIKSSQQFLSDALLKELDVLTK